MRLGDGDDGDDRLAPADRVEDEAEGRLAQAAFWKSGVDSQPTTSSSKSVVAVAGRQWAAKATRPSSLGTARRRSEKETSETVCQSPTSW